MNLIQRLQSVAPVLLLGGLLLATQTGCVAVAAAGAAAGGIGYAKGDLEGYVNAPLSRSVAACNAALTRLKYSKIKEESDAMEATIIARTGDDTKITIKMKQLADKTTEISVRYGVFGDQPMSQVLMTEIRKGI